MTHQYLPSVAIIILNWNNPDDTLACLRSVMALDYPAACRNVIVVDNGSTDDSVVRIRRMHPDILLIATNANLGYAGGNNVGVRHALEQGAEFLCILNNDVVVEPGALELMLAAIQARPDVGIVTPLVAERTHDGDRVWALGAAVDHSTAAVTRLRAGEAAAAWREAAPYEVEVASGAAMLIHRRVFEQVGLLDEAFFLYYEEVDWCLAVRRAGFRILATPAAVVWHKVSASLNRHSPVIDYYMTRNHLRLIQRNWRGWRRWCLWSRSLGRQLLAIAAFTVKSQDGARTPHRNARLLALRDALSGRWGAIGADVTQVCFPPK